MKKKLIALLFILWTYNNTVTTGASPEEINGIGIETIITKQLEQVLSELDLDTVSEGLIRKYTLKDGYTKPVRKEIRQLAKELEIEEEWLYKLFNIESNGNPQAVNSTTGASGLIQFMPATAKNFNTTVEDIRKMSISEQLPLIKQYISKVKGDKKIDNFLDLYLTVFYPRAIGEDHSFVIGSEISEKRAQSVTKHNKTMDRLGNDDGLITKGEIYNWVS